MVAQPQQQQQQQQQKQQQFNQQGQYQQYMMNQQQQQQHPFQQQQQQPQQMYTGPNPAMMQRPLMHRTTSAPEASAGSPRTPRPGSVPQSPASYSHPGTPAGSGAVVMSPAMNPLTSPDPPDAVDPTGSLAAGGGGGGGGGGSNTAPVPWIEYDSYGFPKIGLKGGSPLSPESSFGVQILPDNPVNSVSADNPLNTRNPEGEEVVEATPATPQQPQ